MNPEKGVSLRSKDGMETICAFEENKIVMTCWLKNIHMYIEKQAVLEKEDNKGVLCP